MQPKQRQRQHKSAATLIAKKSAFIDFNRHEKNESNEDLLRTTAIYKFRSRHLSRATRWAVNGCWSLL
jgi:hypothetical protein